MHEVLFLLPKLSYPKGVPEGDSKDDPKEDPKGDPKGDSKGDLIFPRKHFDTKMWRAFH